MGADGRDQPARARQRGRLTIGSVNAVEFFVTLTASLVFLHDAGLSHWQIVAALAHRGRARPRRWAAGWSGACNPRWLMLLFVGLLVIGLSLRTLWMHFSA